MLARLIRFSIQKRWGVLFTALVLMAVGAWQSNRLTVDVFPDLNRPTVAVMTEAPGLAPEEVESLVTFPIETVINGATGVQRVRSNSAVGLSIVYVEFGWEVEILQARQLVAERLQSVRSQLPPGVEPELAPISSIMGQIMMIGLTSTGGQLSPMELRNVADWNIRPRLLAIPGVSQITVIGGGRAQIQVKADPDKLRAAGVSLAELIRALEASNLNAAGGFVEQGGREWLVRAIGRVEDLTDLKRTLVATRAGQQILVEHVATVEYDVQVKRGDAGINGRDGVVVSVQKQPGADTIRLTREVHRVLAEMRATLPASVVVDDRLFLQSNFIETAIGNVQGAMAESAVLVTIVLILFLLNWRTTAISLIALPASFIATAIVFGVAGLSINTMTLGGLAVAIGELVDDAIVDVENIFRRLRENRLRPNPRPAAEVVFRASREVRSSIVYSTMMMCVAFIPLFWMSGLEGRMFQPLGLAYIVAVLASLLVSLTITPALAMVLLPASRSVRDRVQDSFLLRWLKAINLRQLRICLAYPRLIMGSFIILAAVGVLVFLSFGRLFLPPFNEGTVTINMYARPGISLQESNHLGRQAELLLLDVPEVEAVARRTGRAELDEHAEGVHSSELEVRLRSGRPKDEILADVRSRMARIPGVVINVGQPISHRLDHMLSGVNAQVAIKVFGDDLELLRVHAGHVRDAMANVPGIVDLSMEQQQAIPQLRIRILREEAQRLGIQVGDLARAIEAGLNGTKVSEVLEGQRRLDLVVRLSDDIRNDLESLRSLMVDRESGPPVPLSSVAEISEDSGPNTINREDIRRRMVVQANVAGRDVGTVVDEVSRELEKSIVPGLPQGFYLSVEGQFEAQKQAARTIAILSVLSLAVMYALVYGLFRSHLLAACVLMNVPLAMIGAVAAVALTTQTFSIASLMGFLTLMGVCLRNGILLIEHYLNLMREEGEAFSAEMIIRGSQERLAPLLMTSLTSILAMVPFIFTNPGSPGKEMLEPMALVIFGGTLSSTLLAMAYTPAFFWLYGQRAITPRVSDRN